MPNRTLYKELSFAVGITMETPPDEVFGLVRTHDELDEYLHIVKKSINWFFDEKDFTHLNNVWSEITNDKNILHSFNKMDIVSPDTIDILRYARFILIKRLIKKSINDRESKYWSEIFDFSAIEVDFFRNGFLAFPEKLIALMYGYLSGELRLAYSDGVYVLNKYKNLLMELKTLEDESVFKYLSAGRNVRVSGIDYLLQGINEASVNIITTRNDSALSERAFVTELLKLFMYYGKGNPVSSVYRFTRSSFFTNDVERKTIQRCWESVCKTNRLIEDERAEHRNRMRIEREKWLSEYNKDKV